ncbi:MAG: signal recognition particle receptor subunit alpha, partial [Verrucomicrobia bacterium]|nr:signal recognition particle receptor subunit alpha [Verrucomicrobiota bacterium]
MFESLTEKLGNALRNLRGVGKLTEENMAEALKEVRTALLSADVHFKVAREFVERVQTQCVGQEVLKGVAPGQQVVKIIHDELVKLLGEGSTALSGARPLKILMVGLHGSGKTTSSAKLGKLLKKRGYRPFVVGCDVYRPAAIEQLRLLAEQVGADFFPSATGQKPVDIAAAALQHAKTHYHDVLIVDTAGRLAIDEAMMQEIRQLHGAVNPVETLFVVDAMQGQDAINVAKAFSEALPLTGVVLTKLDGDSRGGAALSVRHVTGKPIKFAGTGEKVNGLEPFHPERMASRILGMGDILSLVEEARKGVDQEEAQKL